MKVCTSCNLELAQDAFSRDRTSKDGFCTRCKTCCSVKAKQRYAANPEKVKAAVALYEVNNAEKVAETKRAHYEKNREALALRHAEYYRRNTEAAKARAKKWKQSNPDRHAVNHRAIQATRRARFRQAEGHHSAADIHRILLLQRWKCAGCGADLRKGYHVDHITALSIGGTNWPANLQCLCPACNLSKGAKDAISFAQQNGRLL